MFNSYSEMIAAGVAMVMVLVSANWLWHELLAQLVQHTI